MLKILFLLFFLFPPTSHSCENTNLYESNKSFASIPISDQDSTGTCYAFVATTLFDTERFENGVSTSKRTHPLFSAFAYVDSQFFFSVDLLSSGFTHSALRAVNKRKLCYESDGSKLISQYKGLNNLSDADFMYILEKTYNYFTEESISRREKYGQKEKDFLGCEASVTNTEQEILNNILNGLNIVPESIVPAVVMKKIFKECLDKSTSTALLDINKLVDKGCKNCRDRDFEKYFLKQLKRNKPIGVGYCANVLNDPNAKMVEIKSVFGYFPRRVAKEDCYGHESIIAGSRKKGNKCQFLIRNSWGDWKSSKWRDCLCETSKGVYQACKYGDSKINSVGCWVDSEALTKNTLDSTHF